MLSPLLGYIYPLRIQRSDDPYAFKQLEFNCRYVSQILAAIDEDKYCSDEGENMTLIYRSNRQTVYLHSLLGFAFSGEYGSNYNTGQGQLEILEHIAGRIPHPLTNRDSRVFTGLIKAIEVYHLFPVRPSMLPDGMNFSERLKEAVEDILSLYTQKKAIHYKL